MKKSDWVTLRLLRKMMQSQDKGMWVSDLDVRKATLYLINKYGNKTLNKCIDALAAEGV